MAIIECLLAAGANHLQPDRDGNTPLHAACMKREHAGHYVSSASLQY